MRRVLLITSAKTRSAKESAEVFANRIREKIGKEIRVEIGEISELFFEISKEKVAIYHPKKGFDLKDFDLVVIRHIGKMTVEAHAITQYCENFGIKYTDECLNRLLLDNKISTQFLLWFAGVKNWPHTFYGNLTEMKRRFNEFGGKAILKDNEGSKGRLNFLVESIDEIQKIHDENPDTRFVLQEFIPNNGDLRVLILGDKPALVIGRKSGGDSHLNNTSQGGSSEIIPLKTVSDEILEISKMAAKITKLQVAGVDIMTDSRNNDIYLLEVNNAPQISSGSFVEEKTEEYIKMIKKDGSAMKMKHAIGAFEQIKILKISGQNIDSSPEIIAKIDTGAFSGVIHAENIKEENGLLEFKISSGVKITLEEHDYIVRKVKNTHGGVKKRYLVKFLILLDGEEFEALLGLDDRSKMKFNALIGRAFLNKYGILVDSQKSLKLDEEWRKMGEKQ